VIKTTVGGTASVSHLGIMSNSVQPNPIIDNMQKKIHELKKRAKRDPSNSDD
jgi:hypothetical protein